MFWYIGDDSESDTSKPISTIRFLSKFLKCFYQSDDDLSILGYRNDCPMYRNFKTDQYFGFRTKYHGRILGAWQILMILLRNPLAMQKKLKLFL